MKQGALVFNPKWDRYDVRFGLEDYYGGLHCGTCFDVLINEKWIPTRIEMADDWYLVGVQTKELAGLVVKI